MDNKILESILEKLTRMDDRLSSLEDRLSIKDAINQHDITITVYAETAIAKDKSEQDVVITSYATELVTKHSSPVFNTGYIIKPLDQLYSAHPAIVSCDALWQVLNGLSLVATPKDTILILVAESVWDMFSDGHSFDLPDEVQRIVSQRAKTIRESLNKKYPGCWKINKLNNSQNSLVKEQAQDALDRLLDEI